MPSNKKARSKKKNSGETRRTNTATGFWPKSTQCSNCGREGTEDTPLRVCARCGMASYCSVECQKAAYKEHKEFCKLTAADNNPDDAVALQRILFSRCFGGAVSLLMHQTQHVRVMKGLIHVKCSHPFVEYCKRRQTEDKRSMRISFVPEGEQLLELQERALSDGQSKNDEDGLGALEAALVCRQSLAETMNKLGESMSERIAVVVMEQPGVQGVKISLFLSYMSPAHEAHTSYSCLVRDQQNRWSGISSQVDLDWDFDSSRKESDTTNLDHPLQWLFYNSIGPQFYQNCSLAWQEKRHKKEERSPWPNGVVTPPLALGLDLREGGPGGSDAPYSMNISF